MTVPLPNKSPRPGPQIARPPEPEIGWADYPRIEPGEYRAISGSARVYFDRSFKRHVCCVRFSVLDEWGTGVLVKMPWFLNLGSEPQPRAGRRSRFWREWLGANGGRSPARRGRLSHKIFEHRAAIVLVEDTKTNFQGDGDFEPYSVIREIIQWETN